MKSLSIDLTPVPTSYSSLKTALTPFVKSALQELNAAAPQPTHPKLARSPKPSATKPR